MSRQDIFEVNHRIWGPKKFRPTLPTLVGAVTAAATGVYSYWKGFDIVLPWLLKVWVLKDTSAAQIVSALPEISKHVGVLPRLVVAFIPFAAVYLGFFCYHAVGLARDRSAKIAELSKEKQSWASKRKR